jgi:cyclase
MLMTRVIPVLLLKNGGLVKTVKFKDPTYVGDPINAVKIFNDKEVDELLIIDIEATKEKREPNFELVSRISREAFMPFGYGGGIKSIEEITQMLRLGVEKVSINSTAIKNPDFIKKAAEICGSQSIIVSIDVKTDEFGEHWVFDYVNNTTTELNPVKFAVSMEKNGAGEIILNSVDRDGTFSGYDTDIIKSVSDSVRIPVIAMGGACKIEDFVKAVKAGASAVAAGSFFVFHGKHRAVLITYPAKSELKEAFLRLAV